MAKNKKNIKKDRPIKFKNKAEMDKCIDKLSDMFIKHSKVDMNPEDYAKYNKRHHLY